MDHELISVVVPAYNAERFIVRAIESLLAQTWPSVEVVVVDDGSTDATVAQVRSLDAGVRLVQQQNRGVAAARNAGIAAASGGTIAFLDADDLVLPAKLERQMAVLRSRPDLGCVYCGLHLIDEDDRYVGRMDPAPPELALANTLLLERPLMSVVTGLLPRSVLDDVGPFDERLSTSADCDLAVRVAIAHPVAAVAAPLFLWRQHGGGMHLDPTRTEHDMLIVYEKAFADERLSPALRRRRRRAYANLYVSLAGAYLHRGDRDGVARSLRQAVRYDPSRLVRALGRLTRPGGPEGLPDDW